MYSMYVLALVKFSPEGPEQTKMHINVTCFNAAHCSQQLPDILSLAQFGVCLSVLLPPQCYQSATQGQETCPPGARSRPTKSFDNRLRDRGEREERHTPCLSPSLRGTRCRPKRSRCLLQPESNPIGSTGPGIGECHHSHCRYGSRSTDPSRRALMTSKCLVARMVQRRGDWSKHCLQTHYFRSKSGRNIC